MNAKLNIWVQVGARIWLMLGLIFYGLVTVYAHNPTSSNYFIKNAGQANHRIKYYTTFNNNLIAFEKGAIQFVFEDAKWREQLKPHVTPFNSNHKQINAHAVKMQFIGCNEDATPTADEELALKINFLKATNSNKLPGQVNTYLNIWYKNLYHNIHLKVFAKYENSLKYEFILEPGAKPNSIKINYDGLSKVKLYKGNLLFTTSVNQWTEQAPYAYQIINGIQIPIACKFTLNKTAVGFELGDYDKSLPLVIDPLLIFSTYSGSSIDNFGHAATYDEDGNFYAAGIVEQPLGLAKYPVTQGAFQTTYGGGDWDISISKYNNDGSELIFATYIGGNNSEYPISLVVNKEQELHILGTTLSNNYPVSVTGYDRFKSDSFDMVVTKLNALGTGIIGSTYLGGTGTDGVNFADSLRMNYADEFRGEIQLNKNNEIFIASSTTSGNLFGSSQGYQANKNGKQDGLLVKLNANLSQVLAYTYFGKSNQDAMYSLDVAPNGKVYVVGGTQSTDFTPTPGFTFANYRGGFADGYVAIFDSTLNNLEGFRYWGSPNYDQAYLIKLDYTQNPVIMLQGFDSVSVTSGAYKTDSGSLYITKFTTDLSNVIFSARLGNQQPLNALAPSALMVDICGSIYGSVWAGNTNRSGRYAALHPTRFVSNTFGLQVSANAIKTTTDGSDFWLFSLKPNADSIQYATFYGEAGVGDHVDGGTSRFDKKGIMYQSFCASCTQGVNGKFLTTQGSYSPTNKSPRCSNASAKIDFRLGDILSAGFIIKPKNGCSDSAMFFENNSYNAQKNYWYINNQLIDSSFHLTKSFSTVGTYTAKLVVLSNTTCNAIDSVVKKFTITPSADAKFIYRRDTCSPNIIFTNQSTVYNGTSVPYTWYFGDGNTSKDYNPIYYYNQSGTYKVRLIMSEGSHCADTAETTIQYTSGNQQLIASFTPVDSLYCDFGPLNIKYNGAEGVNFFWYVNDTLVSTSPIGFDSIATKGIYKVKLLVEDQLTCNKKDSLERTYTVLPDTYPDFDHQQDSCTYSVKFINQSLIIPGDSAIYFWRFGDGDSSNLTNPIHQYQDSGTFIVTLEVNKGFSCYHIFYDTISVTSTSKLLNAYFEVSPTPICAPTLFVANNKSTNSNKWYWLVNDVLKDSVNFNYTDSIKNGASINLKLIITNDNTCFKNDTFASNIFTNPYSKANFIVKQDSCSNGIIITNTSVNYSAITPTYFWDFGDGQFSNLPQPNHTYDTSGNYIITLITNQNSPCADTFAYTLNYKLDAYLLDASFTIKDTSLCTPFVLKATNTSTNGTSFLWQVNGINKSTNQHYTDTFVDGNDYEIKLIVKDTNSCKVYDTAVKNISIGNYTKSVFSMFRDSCSLEVNFVNLSNSAHNFVWHFGDGDTSTIKNPTHTYKQAGIYTVWLIYNQGSSCVDTATQTYYIDGDSAQSLFIPNVFTPNQDGKNDCFAIGGLSQKCDEYELWIYNRWGNKVYESTQDDGCWNGNAKNGNPIPDGVYYYILSIKKKSGENSKQNGTVTIIRK